MIPFIAVHDSPYGLGLPLVKRIDAVLRLVLRPALTGRADRAIAHLFETGELRRLTFYPDRDGHRAFRFELADEVQFVIESEKDQFPAMRLPVSGRLRDMPFDQIHRGAEHLKKRWRLDRAAEDEGRAHDRSWTISYGSPFPDVTVAA